MAISDESEKIPPSRLELVAERVAAWLHETFPARQIYIREDGRVVFFHFGPILQASLAGLSLIFLGWVSFASVNVIFKDRIIAAKDHRYFNAVGRYENTVSEYRGDQRFFLKKLGEVVDTENKLKDCLSQLCPPSEKARLTKLANEQVALYGSLAPNESKPGRYASNEDAASGAFRSFWQYGFAATKVLMEYVISAATGKPASVSNEGVASLLIPMIFALAAVTFRLVLSVIRGRTSNTPATVPVAGKVVQRTSRSLKRSKKHMA